MKEYQSDRPDRPRIGRFGRPFSGFENVGSCFCGQSNAGGQRFSHEGATRFQAPAMAVFTITATFMQHCASGNESFHLGSKGNPRATDIIL